jgi:hypothetical protein
MPVMREGHPRTFPDHIGRIPTGHFAPIPAQSPLSVPPVRPAVLRLILSQIPPSEWTAMIGKGF